MRPLKGITVVSLEHAVAAPFCTRHLADLGARVIKIERPSVGDFARHYDTRARGLSSFFVWVNRSKESITLDVKSNDGNAILHRLVAQADVLVQNLVPGASMRLGLSYDQLKSEHPGLIVCDISGYGATGPYRDKKAYDLLIQAEAGVLSTTGTPESPAKSGCSLSDIAAGMYAYSNILAALLQRGNTGCGSYIDISMLEATAEWMGGQLYYACDGAVPPERAGVVHATIYPYGPFVAGDGETLLLGLQNEREWRTFCDRVLMLSCLAEDARFSSNHARNTNRDALRTIIERCFSPMDSSQVTARLDAAGIANARMNDMHALWEHPQLKARRRWCDIETPTGPLPVLIPPGAPDAFEPYMGPIPELGEHTDQVLLELGYDAVTITSLHKQGVV